jgi:hypothetical protein
MRVLVARPPLYDEIAKAFPIRGRDILFAWGDTIFNPGGVPIPPELVAHETVHCQRQLAYCPEFRNLNPELQVTLWWNRYIADKNFRLTEEMPAHIVEYQTILQTIGDNRKARRKALSHVAHKMASSLYGPMISLDDAKHFIAKGWAELREAA